MWKDRAARIKMMVSRMCHSVPGLGSALVISEDGLPITSIMLEEVDEDLVGAMTSHMLMTIDNALKSLDMGVLSIIIVQTSNGMLFIRQVESEDKSYPVTVTLTVLGDSIIPLNLATLHIQKTSSVLSKLM